MLSRRFNLSIAPVNSSISSAFVACPMVLVSGAAHEEIGDLYRVAYEKARELHKPSRWAPLYTSCEN